MSILRAIMFLTCALFLAQTATAVQGNSPSWEKLDEGLEESDIRLIESFEKPIAGVVAASQTAVYLSTEDGMFRRLFSFTNQADRITDIFVDTNRSEVLVATGRGLYRGALTGGPAERIYTCGSERERSCQAVVSLDEGIYLGTSTGLFFRTHKSQHWQQLALLQDDFIQQIVHHAGDLFIVSRRSMTIFSIKTGHWKRRPIRFWTQRTESEASDYSNNPVRAGLSVLADGRYILGADGTFYVGQAEEPAVSLHVAKAPFKETRSILALDGKGQKQGAEPAFLVASERGVYAYMMDRWWPLYRGMAATEAYTLTRTSKQKVLAATGEGVHQMPMSELVNLALSHSDIQENYTSIVRNFDHEPGIAEVQELTVAYAEVNSTKIQQWRRQARKRAWFPKLDIGVDGGRGWSHSDSLWGSSSSGGTHYVGPDDKSASRDIGWDVSLSWDFADIVWSSDQTSIDSRSKLMVELREDVLNQVTRIYFERRRLQLEALVSLSDPQGNIEQQLRIAELTALIDGLTAGAFSRRIENARMRKLKNNGGNTGGEDD